MPRGRHRASFNQVSESDRGRIVAYSDCGLFFREIGQRVGQNQATVMLICHDWMQVETTDRRGRAHASRCTTYRDDKWTVCTATSRTIAQQIQSVTHHSVSARTIRCRLQQSEMSVQHPLLRLLLTGNHRRLPRPWCGERWSWTTEWKDIVFIDESHFCLQYHDDRIPSLETPRTLHSQRRLSEVWSPSKHSVFALSTLIQQDDARPHVARNIQEFCFTHQIELLPWSACSPNPSPI
ncbi:transposable element Tcb1 transposase [Trichonephila clavipes]|nr:transposable element Tcb1 transposase [Trichonephila clavipes]